MTVDFDEVYPAIGRQIKAIRKLKHINQATLASQIGLARTSLSNIEQGIQRLSISKTFEIAFYLGVEISSIIPMSISSFISMQKMDKNLFLLYCLIKTKKLDTWISLKIKAEALNA